MCTAVRCSPVEDVEVEAGKHAFPRPACGEGAAPAHHHVEHRERDEVVLLLSPNAPHQNTPLNHH